MKREIPDAMIDRAVELWCRALRNPKYDNGDRGPNGFMSMALCSMLADKDRQKVADFERAIKRFRGILSAKLKFLRDHQGQPRPAEEIQREKQAGERFVAEQYSLDPHLGCDYHPCRYLREAAKEAGIPDSAFSIKSTVYFNERYVSAHFGYGRESLNHYPLPDGRWLLTTLSGEDMPKVVDYVMGGRPEFEVEAAVNHDVRTRESVPV